MMPDSDRSVCPPALLALFPLPLLLALFPLAATLASDFRTLIHIILSTMEAQLIAQQAAHAAQQALQAQAAEQAAAGAAVTSALAVAAAALASAESQAAAAVFSASASAGLDPAYRAVMAGMAKCVAMSSLSSPAGVAALARGAGFGAAANLPQEAYEARTACARLQKRLGPGVKVHCVVECAPKATVDGIPFTLFSPTLFDPRVAWKTEAAVLRNACSISGMLALAFRAAADLGRLNGAAYVAPGDGDEGQAESEAAAPGLDGEAFVVPPGLEGAGVGGLGVAPAERPSWFTGEVRVFNEEVEPVVVDADLEIDALQTNVMVEAYRLTFKEMVRRSQDTFPPTTKGARPIPPYSALTADFLTSTVLIRELNGAMRSVDLSNGKKIEGLQSATDLSRAGRIERRAYARAALSALKAHCPMFRLCLGLVVTRAKSVHARKATEANRKRQISKVRRDAVGKKEGND